jgi:hypothetical protein
MKSNPIFINRSVPCILTLLILIFCFAQSAHAITYYISTTGNDATGNGTIANPWKTLNKATTTVTGTGNIIHVNAGIYIEPLQSNLAVGVSIEGDGYATTIINSTQTGTWSVFLELHSGDGTNGNQHISGLTFDGGYVSESSFKTWVAIWVTGRSNVHIYNCNIRNWRQRGVIFNGINTDNPGTDVGYNHATGNKFYNSIITNSAAYETASGTGQGSLNIGFQNGMEIYGNTIQQTERPNGFNGWPIKYWNQGWLKGCKIYNNIITKKPYHGTYPGDGGWDFAIEFFNIKGLEIYGNTIQGSIDLNYNYKGSYAYSVWIHDNLLTHPVLNSNHESSIILEFRTESALIENNIVNNRSNFIQYCTRGVNDYGGDNLPNPGGTPVGGYSYILNNIIRKNVCSNIYQGNGIGTSGGILVISEGTDDPQIKNMQIYNNTIVAKSGDAPYVGLDFTSQPYGNGDSLFIRNNIINGFNGAWLQGSNTNTNLNHTTVTNNNAWGNGSNVPVWPAGNPGNYINSNNTALNPLFVSATDFHLQATSPCVNTGVYVGIPYSGTAPEKGYIEIGAPLPVTLVDFTVSENRGKNLLLWKTETEVNSNYFTIERSSNGTDYNAIGTVNASGFSTTVVNYNFIDNNPLAGVNYYRLIIVDKDNSMEYSNVISISGKKNQSTNIVTANLSAAKNTLELSVYATQNKKANLMMFDNNGRNIFTELVLLQNGINTINKKTPALSKGIYYIRLFTEDEVLVKNILGGD